MSIDLTPESDLDVVGANALSIVDRLTDPRIYFELINLCQNHPAKAAQVVMCLAAWHDGADPETLADRARNAAHPEIDWRAVDWVVKERVRMPLNRAERREVVLQLTGQLHDSEIGDLLGLSKDAVQKLRLRMVAA
ncbi:hypothetical protein A5746_00980 [Mycolicibacterium conceptionense]|uniref:hypothetical protein n=1 Tax=Mycolicibacterium conceptionense TaxID=451644 RepID=UPI0003105F5D|nr:hypothetical protein [Mycolicibacterium conceptionense]OBK09042.1 hypothetical protein A5639_11970 [Mycolicibacterium conceptionense]OMB98747.1 hypothetical protein A5746_00980 [Mycolicibacterium conceptionense]